MPAAQTFVVNFGKQRCSKGGEAEVSMPVHVIQIAVAAAFLWIAQQANCSGYASRT